MVNWAAGSGRNEPFTVPWLQSRIPTLKRTAIPTTKEVEILSVKHVSALALILTGITLSGCQQIEFKRDANKVRELSDSTQEDTTVTDVVATEDANGRQATLLSAFFGLDNGLPPVSNQGICRGAGGADRARARILGRGAGDGGRCRDGTERRPARRRRGIAGR